MHHVKYNLSIHSFSSCSFFFFFFFRIREIASKKGMLLRKIFMHRISCTRRQIRIPQFSFSAHFGSQRSVRNNEEIEDTRDAESGEDFAYSEVLRPGPKWQRKPYPTPMKVLISRAKEEKLARKLNPCRVLESAPENGLLVPDLIEVAHRVYNARESLLHGLSVLVEGEAAIPINKCRYAVDPSQPAHLTLFRPRCQRSSG